MTLALARFRANPRTVRVSLRRLVEHDEWAATIAVRHGVRSVSATGETAECAVERAIAKAAAIETPGIDPEMQWSYPHPMKGHAP